jgi:hypothetical protein
MSNTHALSNDGLNDESLVDSYSDTSSAVLETDEAPQSAAKEWTGPRCEKCEAPLTSEIVSICRRCGWYPSLGAFLEVDPNWETHDDDAPAAAEKPELTHLGVWLKMLPRWSWVIIASVLLVIIESVVARFVTPAGSELRTYWSLSQIMIGLLIVAGCHIFNFLVLAADDADFGVLDLLLKPLKLWLRAFHNLPTRLWMVDAAACGLVAVIMSFLVIGGIPYERFWDWGFTPPVKQDLMGAVMKRARQLDSGKGSDDLEEAMKDFAGDADAEGKDLPNVPPPKPKQSADCVILGYRLDKEGRLDTLLLGAVHRGKLVYAGNVRPRMEPGEVRSLIAMLESSRAQQPFIAVEAEAIWVEPKYTCRVKFREKANNGSLREIEWSELLNRIGTK